MTLDIAFGTGDKAIAEKLQADFANTNVKLQRAFLIVLVTTESNADITVQKAIARAQDGGAILVPVITQPAVIPDSLNAFHAVDFVKGYNFPLLLEHMKQLDGQNDQTRGRKWTLIALVVLILIMFGISIYGITSGLIAFPREEFTEIDTIANATRDALIRPTLEWFQPRSTGDAMSFPLTADAAPTILRPFVISTATAISASGKDESEAASQPITNNNAESLRNNPTMDPTTLPSPDQSPGISAPTTPPAPAPSLTLIEATASLPVSTVDPSSLSEIETALAIANLTATAEARATNSPEIRGE